MLEGKEYRATDFRLTIYLWTGALNCQRDPYADECTLITLRYAAKGVHWRRTVIVTEAELLDLSNKIDHFMKIVRDTLAKHCGPGVLVLNLHLLYHIVEDLRTAGKLSVLDTSPFEHYYVHIKTRYRRASRCMKAKMERTLKLF